MEKTMKNKIIISITLLIIFGSIIGYTTYKVINKHNTKLLHVKSEYIIEQAKNCFNEKKCTGTKVTLKTLYELDYLDKQVNPVTKEYYNEEDYVLKEDNDYNFYTVWSSFLFIPSIPPRVPDKSKTM